MHELSIAKHLKWFAYDKKQGNNGERIEQCCPDEKFLGDDMFVKTVSLSEQKQLKITSQIIKLNPQAGTKKMTQFIKG